ncbi:hypothetical protein GQ607_016401 [Colletotrichum asianum]|uniref:Uncharacterized protein n=1 Tax=Colletotrichum asianum TaxID=702518 RepID=A0A8H3VTV0_9PEZI|nr:hypothetical protein GQ607_016401 [Colletotrichum asianum]
MAVADAEESNGQATARQSQIRPMPDSPAPYILITTISPRNNTSTADIVRCACEHRHTRCGEESPTCSIQLNQASTSATHLLHTDPTPLLLPGTSRTRHTGLSPYWTQSAIPSDSGTPFSILSTLITSAQPIPRPRTPKYWVLVPLTAYDSSLSSPLKPTTPPSSEHRSSIASLSRNEEGFSGLTTRPLGHYV